MSSKKDTYRLRNHKSIVCKVHQTVSKFPRNNSKNYIGYLELNAYFGMHLLFEHLKSVSLLQTGQFSGSSSLLSRQSSCHFQNETFQYQMDSYFFKTLKILCVTNTIPFRHRTTISECIDSLIGRGIVAIQLYNCAGDTCKLARQNHLLQKQIHRND